MSDEPDRSEPGATDGSFGEAAMAQEYEPGTLVYEDTDGVRTIEGYISLPEGEPFVKYVTKSHERHVPLPRVYYVDTERRDQNE